MRLSRSLVLVLCIVVGFVLAGCGETRTIIETTPVAQSPVNSGSSGAQATDATSSAGNTGDSSSASDLTESQQNAVSAAESYLRLGGFSRQGLIDQLDSSAGDGYSVHDATVAVDSLSVDYNAQAVRAAKAYLRDSSFSCQGLIQQLDSSAGDEYTQSQASYAAAEVGLCTSGDTGSGDTGNTGVGSTGSTGAGNTGNSGIGNTGNPTGFTYTATVPTITGTPSEADSWPSCRGSISASSNISCSLENNVFYEYWNAATSNDADPGLQVTVHAWADVTRRYYATYCKGSSDGQTVDCVVQGTTGGVSTVSFPVSAVTEYTASNASAYANAHYVGPNG